MKKNFSLMKLIGFILVIILFIIVLMPSYSIWQITKIENNVKNMHDHPIIVISNIINIREKVRIISELTEQAVEHNLPNENIIYKISELKKVINKNLIEVQTQYLGEPSDVEDVRQSYEEIIIQINSVFEIKNRDGIDVATKYIQDNNIEEVYFDLSSKVDTIVRFAQNKANSLRYDAQKKAQTAEKELFIFSLFIFVSSIFMSIFLIRNLKKSFLEMEISFRNVDNGIFEPISHTQVELLEFSLLKKTFNQMIQSIVKSKIHIETKNKELILAKEYAINTTKELEKNELLRRNILETISDMVWLKDPQGVYITCNPEFERFFGVKESGIKGKTDYDFIDKELADSFREHDNKALNSATALVNEEWVIYAIDGSKVLLETTKEKLKDIDGNIIGVLGIGHNITDRSNLQKELEIEKNRFLLAIEGAQDGLWDWNLNTDELFFSYRFETMLGYDKGDLSRTIDAWFGLLHPDDKEEASKVVQEYLDKKGENSYENSFRLRAKDGSWIWILARGKAEFDMHGTPLRFVGFNTDITDQKERENSLKMAEQKAQELLTEQESLLSLFNKGDSVLFKWKNDESWHVKYVSNSATKLLGHSIEDFLSNKVAYSSCIHKDDIEHVTSEVVNAVEQNKDFFVHDTYRVVTNKNQIKWVLDYTVTQKDSDGNILYFIGYIIDITESKENEIKLIKAKEDAEKATKTKSEFLANMSHEIRTPLNGVIGLTNLVLQTPLNDMQKDYLNKSISSSNALLHVISDILDYSKIEANKIEFEEISFKLDEMFYELSNLFSYQVDKKGIDFRCIIAPSVHNNLIGDPFRIMQILINLVGNSIKFTDNGLITVLVDSKAINGDNTKLSFQVQDSGIGISQEKQNCLFKEFSQVDPSNTREHGGTGLGLAISKKLAQLMGGELSVESKEGEGSTFSFELDLNFITKDYQFLSHNLENKKVLVVDDQKIMRDLLREMLESFGMNVSTCESAYLALNILQEDDYDFIITDWKMPEMDGIELIANIQKNDNIKLPQILLISAYATKEKLLMIAESESVHIDKILLKPFSSSSLLDRLVNNNFSLKSEYIEKISAKGKVLLAEDNEINQIVASQNLQNFGLEVIIVENGAMAVQKAEKEDFDLIFMDLQMPVMDGFEASKKIREFNKDIPIVALSAAVMKEDIQLAQDSGMNEHLAKPINIKELEKVLAKYLEVKSEKIIKNETLDIVEDIKGINLKELFERLNMNTVTTYKLLVEFAKDKKDIITTLESLNPESIEFDDLLHNLKGLSGNLSLNDVYKYSSAIYISENIDEKIKLLPKLKESLKVVLTSINNQIAGKLEHKEMGQEYSTNDLLSYIKNVSDDIEMGTFITEDKVRTLIEQVRALLDDKSALELEGYFSVFDYKNAGLVLNKIKGLLI